MRRRLWEETRTKLEGPPPEFEPEYADDGFSGGTLSSIWTSFEQERMLADKFGIRFGENFQGDLRPFRELGVRIISGGDIRMLQDPIAGTSEHFTIWVHDIQ